MNHRRSSPVAISVVIPTVRPAEMLEPTLESLARQTLASDRFEVVVVLDGPDGGRAADLDRRPRPYRLVVRGSAGRGRAAACDAGIDVATGAVIMLLDDDMTLEPDALDAHVARHEAASRTGVMGAVPVVVSPASGFATRFIARRFARHLAKLARPVYRIDVRDVYTGAFSIERDVFQAVGGFDRRFTEYGNEDGELAGRLVAAGVDIVFAPDAVAHQAYDKAFDDLAADSVAKGRTAVQFMRAHPDRSEESAIVRRRRGSAARRFVRRLLRAAVAEPGRAARLAFITERSAAAIERIRPSLADRVAETFLDACFWAGVQSMTSVPIAAAQTVVHYVDGGPAGGVERVAATLVRGLDQSAWRAALVVGGRTENGAWLQELRGDGAVVREVQVPPGLRSWLAVPRLARAFRGLRPAIVHVHRSWAPSGNAAVVAARIAGARVIATEHLFLPTTPRRAIWLRRALDRLVDRTIVVSTDVGQTAVRTFHTDPDRLRVVRNGVAPPDGVDAAAVGAIRKAILDGATASIVLVPARLQPQKDHATLLGALVELPDVVAALAGNGPERGRLVALADELGIADRIRFLGDRGDMPALMSAADIVVLPSRAEGLPLVILEAFALARPVVATAVGGVPELLIDGETGRSIPQGDPAALASAIRGLLADPVTCRQMGQRAKARYEAAFTAERMVRETAAVYDEVMPDVTIARESIRDDRGADWRYLALRSRFRAIATFGWPPGALDDVATTTIDGPTAPDAVADVAVALEPDPGVVARMRSVLDGDGLAVVRTRRVARMTGMLRAAGFAGVRSFAAWPSPDDPRAYVPLDDEVAARRILGRTHDGLRGRLGAARRRLWLLRQRLGGGESVYVVGWLGRAIGQDLVSAWRIAHGHELPAELSWTVLTGGRASISKVVGIVTPLHADAPGLAIKWPRTDAAAAALAREAAILSQLQARGTSVEVPRLVETWPDPEGGTIVETMLPGVPLGRVLTPARYQGVGALVVDWLERLPASGPDDADLAPSALAEALIDRLERRLGSAVASDLIARQRSLVRDLDGVPLVVEHRDLAPWNILVEDLHVGVVDWESSVSPGLPVLDLWYFLTYAALAVERIPEARLAEVYPRLHDPRTPTGKVSATLLHGYVASLGLDPDVVPALRALTWVAHLPSELDRRPPAADPMTATFMRLWAHELAD